MSTKWVNKERLVEDKLQEVYEKLYAVLGHFDRSYIAGGSITSIVLGEPVNDYDVWFEDLDAWKLAVSLVREKCNFGNGHIVVETPNAVTFKIPTVDAPFQFIRSMIGQPEDVIDGFDYKHTQAYFLPGGPTCEPELNFYGFNSVGLIESKLLFFTGKCHSPSKMVQRAMKFSSRGYVVPKPTVAKIIRYLRKLDTDFIDQDIATNSSYDGY